MAIHINPDHFLETDTGRIVTHDRNNHAWQQSYRTYQQALLNADPDTEVYVLIGAQGAGKSMWAREFAHNKQKTIIFDAILVKFIERTPIIRAAEARGLNVIAVWFKTPLEQCLARNAKRPSDELVSEQAIRNVFAAIEPPSTSEGFSQIIEVYPSTK